jgi:hypothetical protein
MSAAPTIEPARWWIILFRVLAALVGLFFLTTVQAALAPWGAVPDLGQVDFHHPDLHRWSDALAGAPDVMMALLLLYCAWRPRQAALILQWMLLAVVVFLALNCPFVGPMLVIIAIPFLLTAAIYPWPRALLVPPWQAGITWPTLVLTILTALLVVPDAWHALVWQVQGTSELARNHDWASNAEHDINLVLAGVAAAMCRPGRRALSGLVGATFIYLGVAAISRPHNPGSWGAAGGALALVGGLAYVALAVFSERSVRSESAQERLAIRV